MSFARKFTWGNKTAGYTSVRAHGLAGDEQVNNPEKLLGGHNPRMPANWRNILTAGAAVSTVLGIGLLATQLSGGGPLGHRREHPCGNSSAEALALGCSFDHLTWVWYPAYCPHYTNDMFRASEGGFGYYETQGSKDPLDEEGFYRLLDTKVSVWVEKREHLTHCVYLMLAQAQVIRDRTRYIPKLVEYEHLEHCANFLLESLRKDPEWRLRNTLTPPTHYDQDC